MPSATTATLPCATHTAGPEWTSILGASMVNEARFGWFKDRLFDPASDDFLYPGLGRAQLSVSGTGNLGLGHELPAPEPEREPFLICRQPELDQGRSLDQIRRRALTRAGLCFAACEPVRHIQLLDLEQLRARLHGQHLRRQELEHVFPDVRKSHRGPEPGHLWPLCAGPVQDQQPDHPEFRRPLRLHQRSAA